MAYFLGIDGGGSKTEAALADENKLLERATAATCKIQVVGEERARAALQQAIQDACSQAGIQAAQLTRVVVGVSGVSRPGVREKITATVRELTEANLEIVGDNVVALTAAFGDGPGVLVIGGTGSIAFGRNEKGESARSGGWGPAISDVGSGTWIGRIAVVEAMHAADGGVETPLMGDIMAAWNAATPEDVASIANTVRASNFAALSPVVMRRAGQGDEQAMAILQRSGKSLADMARIVLSRLWRAPAGQRVAIAGGVFHHSPEVRAAFTDALEKSCPSVQVATELTEPVLGALAMACGKAASGRAAS